MYHASNDKGEEFAVKVYKTSILIFKDRDRYVTGEFRFRNGYAKHNPRKMVRVWAEKETRNLNRLKVAEILCPSVVLLRSHVLVITFIGKDGRAAPRLKDAEIPEEKARELYLDIIKIMRKMYHQCRLVHADFSEYNILYFKGTAWVIDVSQSVEHDHPHALEFLRIDCANITKFFANKQVPVMTIRELFDFVTDITITDQNLELYIEKMQELIQSRPPRTPAELVNEEVFMQVYIPRTLDQVFDAEKDMNRAGKGELRDTFYQSVTGLRLDLGGAQAVPALLQKDATSGNNNDDEAKETEKTDENNNDSDSASDDDSDDSEAEKKESNGKEEGKDGEPPKELTKKEQKKLVKEMNREKRKTKIPKHIKRSKRKGTNTRTK